MLVGLVGVFASSAVAVGALWWCGYRVNISSSLPLGIYQFHEVDPEVGELVAFCVPDRLAHMEIFGQLTVNPCFGGGLGVPLLKRVETVSGSELFLVGESARSVDSRIFGPIQREEILGTVRVVYVYGK